MARIGRRAAEPVTESYNTALSTQCVLRSHRNQYGALASVKGRPVQSRALSNFTSQHDVPRPRSVSELRKLDGIKWSKYGDNVIPAWVADMDLAPPDVVLQAIQRVLDVGDFGYNFVDVDRLAPLFCQWQQHYHGWAPEEAEISVFCDVLHAIDIALWLHTKPGDGVILLTPVYPPFIGAVNGAGRRIVSVPLSQPDWGLDADRLADAVDENTKVILLCHPHNPTGRTFSTAEREAIAEVVLANDLLLISDEVWGDLLHRSDADSLAAGSSGRHVPMASLDGLASSTLTVSSASKSFSLAGLRCAVAHVGHDGLRAQFDGLPKHFLGAVSTPGAAATAAAWSEGHEWLDCTRSFLTERLDQTMALVAQRLPGVTMTRPEATYLAWLDVSALAPIVGPSPAAWFLEHAGVALGEGTDFGPEGSDFLRLNFATSAEILDTVVDRMASALERAQGGT